MPIVDVMNVRLVSAGPDETVQAAIARMLEANVGSVGITDGARLVGIFTERDVLRLAGDDPDFARRRVGDVMTTALVTVSPDDDVISAARIMGERRIRHLPVVQGENLLGIVGIRDVMAALVEKLWAAHDAEARETVRQLLGRTRAGF